MRASSENMLAALSRRLRVRCPWVAQKAIETNELAQRLEALELRLAEKG